MKKLLVAAVGASMLAGGAAAFAQGVPAGTVPPTYGSAWAAQKQAADRAAEQSKLSQSSVPGTVDRTANSSEPRHSYN
jgi:ABC-type sugar transport system substrate-binding protein